MKYVTLLNDNGTNTIINEFTNLNSAFESFNTLDVEDLEDNQEYELAKYDEDNQVLDWEDSELISLNQPLNQWVIKAK